MLRAFRVHYSRVGLSIDDFDYELPPELIAQHPSATRSGSRLLHSSGESLSDHRFSDLPELLTPGDLLVFNDTKVIKARLFGRKETGGRIEVLIERLLPRNEALAQVHAGRAAKPGSTLALDGGLALSVLGREGEFYRLRFPEGEDALAALERHGRVPLPPYITHAPESEDASRYQTVYAREAGSAAAPTAGLHFTPELLAGLDVERVTLHVGLDTFRPVSEERLEDHVIHGERYAVEEDAWARIESAPRVLAVGTTTVRVLETLARDAPLAGRTELFVTPGFEFRRVDALLTNFHLPRSTLLALVMAFAGVEETRRLYRLAVEERYRFYSFGDAMLIL